MYNESPDQLKVPDPSLAIFLHGGNDFPDGENPTAIMRGCLMNGRLSWSGISLRCRSYPWLKRSMLTLGHKWSARDVARQAKPLIAHGRH